MPQRNEGTNSGSAPEVNSIPSLASLADRLRPTDDGREANGSIRSDGRRADSSLHKSSRHPSKAEHFRRLEDRMDEMQQQMAVTQRMIRELAEAVKKQAREPREPRASAARQNFRNLSGRALATMLASSTATNGPPASMPIATTVLAAMKSSTTSTAVTPGLVGETGESSHSHTGTPIGDIAEGVETSSDAIPPRKSSGFGTATGARRMSASNPVLLSPEREASRTSTVMAMTYATAFVKEAADAVAAKKLQEGGSTRLKPLARIGPLLSRRFSVSLLNLSAPRSDGLVARAAKWARRVFKHRVEPTVSPDEVLAARSGGAAMHPLTIRHDSVHRSIWDSIVLLMIVLDIVVTPLSLSFRYFPPWISVFNAIGNGIFATDFVVNMFSSYTTSHGVLVSGPRETIRHYLLSVWSLPDLLSWFPFEVFVSADRGRFLGVAKVIRLAKVSQLSRRVHSSKKAGIFRFVRLLGTVFIVSHALSCYWNWVAAVWRVNEEGYMLKNLAEKYAHCWSLVIGSLNASPPQMYTPIEEISVAFFMLIGNVLQATVFGSVAVLISSFDEEEVAYNKKIISTYERCRFLDIPEKLARRIQGYYENLYKETRSVSPDADAFINELSPALICEVKFQLYRDMITQIPFLSATHINPVVIEMLILHLRTVIYMQDDVLIRKGEFGDWMGFIGSKGSVGVLDPNSETRKIIRILRKGDYFGEMALLQRSKRSTTAIALSWVQIHVLCRADLDDVKEQYPEQGEILEEEIIKYMKAKVTYK